MRSDAGVIEDLADAAICSGHDRVPVVVIRRVESVDRNELLKRAGSEFVPTNISRTPVNLAQVSVAVRDYHMLSAVVVAHECANRKRRAIYGQLRVPDPLLRI